MTDDRLDSVSRRDFGKLVGLSAIAGAFPNAAINASFTERNENHVTESNTAAPDDICDLTAVDLASRIRRKQLSALEVMTAHLARIERVNPKINAVVTLVSERAMADAKKADAWQASGRPLGVLHGLPVAHKDLLNTAGIRTTFGSSLFRDNVPTVDALIVKRTTAAGAITLGKTNTPEFGAGSNTFNAVFGATLNPYNIEKTVGGSSGGAAASLRCGMVPLASGSDTGGSLRNPAAFCNVVGLRPTPGRVPDDDGSWSPLSTNGPMARTVADVALFLSAMVGSHAPDPLCIDEGGAQFRAPLARSFKGIRVAWCKDLGGIPFESEITRVVNANRNAFADLGCVVEDAEPDFTGVDDAFPTLRHLSYHSNHSKAARDNPTMYKESIKWEIAEAERNSGADVARAMARQARMSLDVARFFERYDFFVLPVTQVAPFDVATEYPTIVAGEKMPTYIDWMRSCWYVTFMACPCISVPGGFTASGLPVGLQIVAKRRADWALLQMAYAFEPATRPGARAPKL